MSTTYTLAQANAIRDRAITFGLTGGHVAVRIAAAGVIDHLEGWEGFQCSADELDEALEPVWLIYADLLAAPEKAIAA